MEKRTDFPATGIENSVLLLELIIQAHKSNMLDRNVPVSREK